MPLPLPPPSSSSSHTKFSLPFFSSSGTATSNKTTQALHSITSAFKARSDGGGGGLWARPRRREGGRERGLLRREPVFEKSERARGFFFVLCVCECVPCPHARLLGTLMLGNLYSPLFRLHSSTSLHCNRRSFCPLRLASCSNTKQKATRHVPRFRCLFSSCFAPAFATTRRTNVRPRSPAYFPRADPRRRCGYSRGVRHEVERRDRQGQPQHEGITKLLLVTCHPTTVNHKHALPQSSTIETGCRFTSSCRR